MLGQEKAAQCKLCIQNLDQIHEDLLLACAKGEKMAADDLPQISKFKVEVMDLNLKAEDHMDAAKLARNKLRNFLQAQ